jgi:hypothetical protein
MRLGGNDAPTFQNRAHFFGAAAEAMRRILIEHARRRMAAKRGGGVAPSRLSCPGNIVFTSGCANHRQRM